MIAVVVVVILIIVTLFMFFFKKRSIPVSPPDLPSKCLKNGESCSNSNSCCNGICDGICKSESYPSFLTGNIHYNNQTLIVTQGILSLGEKESNYVTWDGTNKISFSTPIINTNGTVISVDMKYLNNVGDNTLAEVGDEGSDVSINKDGTISSTDYSHYLTVDKLGQISWQSYFTVGLNPTIFTFNSCPDTQTCKSNSDCCGPFNKCGPDNKCQKCFGDMEELKSTCCSEPPCKEIGADYLIECKNNVLKCENRCENMVAHCSDDSDPKCSYDGNKWELKCVSKCKEDPPTNCLNYDCKKKDDDTWGFHCEEKSCTPIGIPDCGVKTCDESGLNCSYKKDGKHVIPQFDCGWQNWKCTETCDPTQCSNLKCNSGMFPSCNDTTHVCECKSNPEPDICAAIPKPPFDDAKCKYVDESHCDGPPAGWRWYDESTITNQCVLAALNKDKGWKQAPCKDDHNNTHNIMIVGNTPVYPTVAADQCRGNFASVSEINPNINNPMGHVTNLNTANCKFTPYDLDHFDYYKSESSAVEPYCLLNTKEICQNKGMYVPSSNPFMKTIESIYSNPIPSEIISSGAGSCSCPEQTAGLNCEISRFQCSKHGYPQVSPGDRTKYTCVCDKGFLGDKCEVDSSLCKNGVLSKDKKCECFSEWQGNNCDVNRMLKELQYGTYYIQNEDGNYLGIKPAKTGKNGTEIVDNENTLLDIDFSDDTYILMLSPEKFPWVYDETKTLSTKINNVGPFYLTAPAFGSYTAVKHIQNNMVSKIDRNPSIGYLTGQVSKDKVSIALVDNSQNTGIINILNGENDYFLSSRDTTNISTYAKDTEHMSIKNFLNNKIMNVYTSIPLPVIKKSTGSSGWKFTRVNVPTCKSMKCIPSNLYPEKITGVESDNLPDDLDPDYTSILEGYIFLNSLPPIGECSKLSSRQNVLSCYLKFIDYNSNYYHGNSNWASYIR